MHNYYGKGPNIVVVEDEYGKRDYKEANPKAEQILKQENKIEELTRVRKFLKKFLEVNPSIEEKLKQTRKNIIIKIIVALGVGALVTAFITVFSPLFTTLEGFKCVYPVIVTLVGGFGIFMTKEEIDNYNNYKEARTSKEAKVYYLDEQLKVENQKLKDLGELKSIVPPKDIILDPAQRINYEIMVGELRKVLEEWKMFYLAQKTTQDFPEIYSEFQEEQQRKRERNKY